MPRARKSEQLPTFEANMKQLEKIVGELDRGEVDLDKSLELYEQGARLIEACRKQLTEAEARIEKLRPAADGSLETEPFDEDAEE